MSKGTLLVVGLIAGGLIGWFTAPQPAVDIHVGGVNIQTDGSGGGSMTVGESDGTVQVDIAKPGGFLPDPTTRAIVFAIVGGILGFGIGVLTDRRKAGA